MRDPARIKRLLTKLEAYWVEHPDLRLCQVLGNCFPGVRDLYHIEDNEVEQALARDIIKHKGKYNEGT